MKRTILSIAGAIVLSLSSANAQEADRFVGSQHVKFQAACHPEDVKHFRWSDACEHHVDIREFLGTGSRC